MAHSSFIYPGNLLIWVMSICLPVLNLSPQYTLHKIHMQMALRSTCFQLHNQELVNEQMISISSPKSYDTISECNTVSTRNLPQSFVVCYDILWYDISLIKIMPSVWRIEAGLCNTKFLVDTNDSDLRLTFSTQGQRAHWTASPRDYICGHLRATCVCVCVCLCWLHLFE